MAKSKLTPLEKILHEQFTRYGRNAREWLRKCAILLPHIEKHEIWRKRRCSSIYEYAAKVAGMNHDQTREALRVMNWIEDKPELVAMAEKKGINAVKPVATIATKETAKLWADRIEAMSVQGVTAMAREERKSRNVSTSQPVKMQNAIQTAVQNDGEKPAKSNNEVTLNLPTPLARRLERVSKLADFAQLMEKFVEGIEQMEESQKPEPVETDSRHIPTKIEEFSRERTGDKCAFPGCFKNIFQLHHTQRWALHHIHDPDKLWGLCQTHNELAHLGLIENEEGRPETWRLRKTPDWTGGYDKWLVDQRVQAQRAAGIGL